MKKAALLILDGWGLNPNPKVSAIAAAETPFFEQLWAENPHNTLTTFGEEVGLPDGQMGNSEVGHLNIGAGRVVYQELARINKAAREGELAKNTILQQAIQTAKASNKPFHIMGLISDGGVHSHISHLLALLDILLVAGLDNIYIHGFLDGRDCSPTSGKGFINQLLAHISPHQDKIKLQSVIGRYYAMDRDKRWERVAQAYGLLTAGKGEYCPDIEAAIADFYTQKNITDEFMPALCCVPISEFVPIGEGDVLLCFNFRTDRCREISEVLTQRDFPEFGMKRLDLHYFTMCRYDESFQNVGVLFEKEDLSETLGEVISKNGLSQLRIAETEKYPHVTFFFSGGREQPFENEHRIIVPSPKVATYDLQPEMSARGITAQLMEFINQQEVDFIGLNFANTDMVGHTGDFNAAKKAAETVDFCLSELVPFLRQRGYELLIIADHGNADIMMNEDGSPHTAHTKNPVPIIYVGSEPKRSLQAGKLADVAPTLLDLMGIRPPLQMQGEILLR